MGADHQYLCFNVDAPKNSALSQSGLRNGDLIIKCNGQKTDTIQMLLTICSGHSPSEQSAVA